MYLGHVSGRKVVPDCRRLGSSACSETELNPRPLAASNKRGYSQSSGQVSSLL